MHQIGLLSDTHSSFPESLFDFFQSCDQIWHAGDVGSIEVIRSLETIAPVRGVYGNIDGKEIRLHFKEFIDFRLEDLRVWMLHIGGYPPRYNQVLRKKLLLEQPNLLICGHSHILKIMNDSQHQLLYLNPGAAGNYGSHKKMTALRFKLDKGRIFDMEVYEKNRK